MTAQLHDEGLIINHKKVMRLMKEHGLKVRQRRRFVATTDSNHNSPIFPNRAKDMVLTGPNQLWVADIIPAFAGTGSISRSQPALYTLPPSWMPGHGVSPAMPSDDGSMHA